MTPLPFKIGDIVHWKANIPGLFQVHDTNKRQRTVYLTPLTYIYGSPITVRGLAFEDHPWSVDRLELGGSPTI